MHNFSNQKNFHIHSIQLIPKTKFWITFQYDISDEDLELDDKVVDMKYILELESLVIVTDKGMILQLKVNDQEIEPVGMIDGGILGAQWSPNQEQLIIASRSSNLVSLNTNFDILNEVPIDEEKENVQDQPVYISWKNDAKFFMTNYALEGGRKALTRDTELNMFRSAAKSDPQGGIVESFAEKAVHELQGTHHWQPNSNFIGGWERKLLKDETDKYMTRICFWEKNGLRHLEFNLPSFNSKHSLEHETDLIVKGVQWNRDSDILCIFSEDENQKQYVLLYHRSNYRWYLKKAFQGIEGQNIKQIYWCNTSVCRLFILYQNNIIEALDLSLSHSLNNQDTALKSSLALGLSVDNSHILTTLYSKNILPPPMSNFNLKFSSQIEAFSFGSNYIFVVTNNSFELCIMNKKMELKTYKVENTLLKNQDRIRSVFYNANEHVLFGVKNDNTIFIIKFDFDKDNNNYTLVSQSLEEMEFQEQIYSVCGSAQYFLNFKKEKIDNVQAEKKEESNNFFNNNMVHFSNIPQGNNMELNENQPTNKKGKGFCYFSTETGKIYKFYYQSKKTELAKQMQVPPTKIIVSSVNGEEKFLGISSNLRLQHDQKIVCSECTSFMVFKNFLAFTTKSQMMYEALYILDFKDPKSPLQELEQNIYHKLPKQLDGENFIVRNIERGCKIVSITPNLKLVFQASRGNLEGIYPRILLLKKVKELIYEFKYKRAFEICRTHKLDINLIFDCHPQQFIEKSTDLLKQIQLTDYYNIFVQSLQNELSSELQYAVTQQELKNISAFFTAELARQGKSKINLICDLVIRDLKDQNNEQLLYTIMTTHIKKEPSELESVLNQIKQLKDSEKDQDEEEVIPPHLNQETGEKFKPSKQVTAKKLLEFVCWLAEANRMYEVALLTYDLDLVAMVAEFTSKDPREYLPYFEKIKAIEDQVEKRYQICIDLNKYAQAVIELSHGNEEQIQKSIELIKQHNIYNTGIQTYQNNPKILRTIKNYLGDYLSAQKEYSQSILAYESAQNYEKALEQAESSYDFQKVYHFLKLLKNNKEERVKYLQQQIQVGKDNNQYNYIAQIYKKLKDYKLAIEYFVKCEDWKEVVQSLNLIQSLDDQDKIVKDLIRPAIKLQANIKGNQIKKFILDFNQKHSRLKVLQNEKRNTPSLMSQMKALGGGQLGTGQPDFETESDISAHTQTTQSSRTSYTYSQTTGTKKKREKNRKSLIHRKVAEGSPLEEEYLVACLKHIQTQTQIYSETKNLIQYLIYFAELEEGEELNKLMKKLQSESNHKVKTVQQEVFEEQHPELRMVYPNNEEFKIDDNKIVDVSLSNFDFIYEEIIHNQKKTKGKPQKKN
ncbi:WD40-repeat-containing domain [Pseudocohnilembus persalinus]|uniref:Elongator complex protein 1 n=1 Tax=Pseudocohnilembus persalinus TaxID=266149 RepID=A0A0V0QUZ9_PSEPJ|nr:WD40-repeat-containing domain [Pseudocohnilembus persalinus]|eukprot:KRX06033.1 WD40-repeat-containing domain [Pseudocohnilembus persalinus]